MSIEREAADWFARMRGPDAESLREAFEVWRSDPARAQAYDDKLRVWDATMFLANTATGKHRNLEGYRSRKFTRPTLTWAAAAFLAIGIGIMLALHGAGERDAQSSSHRLESAAMDKVPRTIRLPDGSKVILDRGARLQIAFHVGERRLRLIAGRARFAVAHEKRRPFIVEAGGGGVVAHGTLFDVELLPDGTDVSLLEGAIAVSSLHAGGGSIDLEAGQSVSLVGGKLGKPRTAASADRQWPRDMIAFERQELVDAVAAFNRTSSIPVVVDGSVPSGMKITGSFHRSDAEAFAWQVAETFGLQVETKDDGTLMLAYPMRGKDRKNL
ncbi:MAG: hypothetical protein DI555_22750 [Novosphingobium pentaromativorans]|uniref:DUF4880 domain-containing protein n=1 Tax=Novosphingobium pentaromativorans TaxID=205844 RepID=A0A2W5NE68_9SPHN|nr:MAG: hypothetical protein DI555_22750 [Novosphingobium pentaromativorans]